MKMNVDKLKKEFEELMKGTEPYIEENPTLIKLDALQKRIELMAKIEKYKMLFWLSFAYNTIITVVVVVF